MITFPCAKINLGLNVVGVRPDGYHDLETVFYPLPLTDALEVKRNMLAKDFELPRVHAHLFKRIPSQAGLGGGSSDGAFMIRLLDERFRLNIGIAEMERYAGRLGADCPFFITAEPSFATGIGDILEPADNEYGNLSGYHIAIVKPSAAVSTKEAYQGVAIRKPEKSCRDIVRQPIETWRDELKNDFEDSVFKLIPSLPQIKAKLYDMGAIYAQMSGSGSAIFGIFKENPANLQQVFDDCFTYSGLLQ